MKETYHFTSESVSAGHPDKVADQISDALLDAALQKGDSTTRCAIETFVTTNCVIVGGEVKNYNLTRSETEDVVRQTIKKIGYEQHAFHWESVNFTNKLHQQSADIALGTDDFGAGDQGLMFGYACRDNEAFMPAPIYFAHRIIENLAKYRKTYDFLQPDAKSQVTIRYEGGVPKWVDTVVVSTQHTAGNGQLAREAAKACVHNACGGYLHEDTKWHLNPTGNFVIGGPDGDVGLTGRKIIVDTYGGFAPHGGGAFSGKDPTKVDRSAAYMARWLAKNVVADNMADWCQVQLSYAIGVKEPTSIYVDSNGHNRSIIKFIRDNIDLTPKGIIDRFDLMNFTSYSENCVLGHFGDKNVPWERIGWD